MSSKKQYTKSGVQRSPVLTVFRKPWFLHAFSIILILSNSWLSVWMRKRAGSFPPPHILAINHAEVHCLLYLQSWFWGQCSQFTAVTFNFNSRSVFTLHWNILSWNLSKWTHMTLTYLTLQIWKWPTSEMAGSPSQVIWTNSPYCYCPGSCERENIFCF